jgi:transcriptional regulator GlxA family with amidase domain
MRIAVLLLDGVFDTGLSAVLDTLELANQFATTRAPFSVSKVAVRRKVTTGQGLKVPLTLGARGSPELVIVPALGAKTPAQLEVALASSEARDAMELLQRYRAAGATIAAACTATFLLAQTSMLDGRTATTTWWLAPTFRERFPRVLLREGQMLVEADKLVTAGAALAHLDLALWVVRRSSPKLARITARHLTFDGRASQGTYVMPDHLAYDDPMVQQFEAWAREHLKGFSIPAAARAIGTSQRTLERKVSRVIGMSPLEYVRVLRVEEARAQLETTDRGLDEIAAAVGYENGATLRTLLRDKTGRGLRELRFRHPQ